MPSESLSGDSAGTPKGNLEQREHNTYSPPAPCSPSYAIRPRSSTMAPGPCQIPRVLPYGILVPSSAKANEMFGQPTPQRAHPGGGSHAENPRQCVHWLCNKRISVANIREPGFSTGPTPPVLFSNLGAGVALRVIQMVFLDYELPIHDGLK